MIEEQLGSEALRQMHIHLSGIEYGPRGGERQHLPFEQTDLDYKEVLRALVDHNVAGWLVCESPPILEEDALILQDLYKQLKNENRGI